MLTFKNIKSWFGSQKWRVGTILFAILFIVSFFDMCSKKGDVKDTTQELETCTANLEACENATIELQKINADNEAILRDIEIPEALTNDNTAREIQLLKEQVHRNKLKQVELVGDCETDKAALQGAVNERDAQILTLYLQMQGIADTANAYAMLLNQQNEILKNRLYQDSILEENYTGYYQISTTGIMTDFNLSVNPKQTVVTRTIKQPAPPAEEYRYKNSVSLKYSPSTSWNTKYFVEQRAGIEYQRDMKYVKLRAEANYLIESKDYEGKLSFLLSPFVWGKK